MNTRPLQLIAALLVGGLTMASCVEVGERPAGQEPCDSPGQMRCMNANELEVCSEAEGWIGVLTCGTSDSCFHSPLKAPSCMPRFDCFDTAVNYISCDVADTLTTVEQDSCKTACRDHADNDTYEALVNCYGDMQCESQDKPYACVQDNCQLHLTSCMSTRALDMSSGNGGNAPPEDAENSGPMMGASESVAGACETLRDCYGACTGSCHSQCADEESLTTQMSCQAECLSNLSACESECRSTAPSEAQAAFLDYGICQLVHCSGEGVSQDECAWQHCRTEYAGCLADQAVGEETCSASAACLVSAESTEEMAGCIAGSAFDHISEALAVYSCWQDRRDQCEGDDTEACVADLCAVEHEACVD